MFDGGVDGEKGMEESWVNNNISKDLEKWFRY